ncbi:MAG: cold shock domain-containing protein [Alphaproteobacteria bacterium]|nr:cold shock domain-containing protein [Alphaproteobacteria bacterium]
MSVQQGTVKWFNATKGYGFISQDSGGEIFVHVSEIQDKQFPTLLEGQRVEFVVGRGKKGPCAQTVKKLAAASAA